MTLDRIVDNSDRIYGDALNNISTSHKELAKTMIESSSENDRIVHLLHTTEKKIIKVPAETRITDERTGEEIQVGQRVSVGKDRVSTIEAEVASLWEQWEAAQKEVNDIKAELSSAIGDNNGARSRSTDIVQESLAAEMAKFEVELTATLEHVHEDARTSEKASRGPVHSSVFFLTVFLCPGLQQADQGRHVCPSATVLLGGLSVFHTALHDRRNGVGRFT